MFYDHVLRRLIPDLLGEGFALSVDRKDGLAASDALIILEKISSPILYLVLLADAQATDPAELEKRLEVHLSHRKESLSDVFCTGIVSLVILVDRQVQQSLVDFVDKREAVPGEGVYPIWWYFTEETLSIITHPNNPKKILNIQKMLENIPKEETSRVETQEPFSKMVQRAQEDAMLPLQSHSITLTLVLMGAMAMVFAYITYTGKQDLYYAMLGTERSSILASGEWYRLLSALFLHGDVAHLVQNAIFLYFFGTRIELLYGKWRLFLLFLLSGVGGGLLSIALQPMTLSIGASGGILGLGAALICYSRKYGRRNLGMPYVTLWTLIAIQLLSGFLIPKTDTFAHIGGFLTGMLIAALLLVRMDSSPVE